jgi:hypothetical protein
MIGDSGKSNGSGNNFITTPMGIVGKISGYGSNKARDCGWESSGSDGSGSSTY